MNEQTVPLHRDLVPYLVPTRRGTSLKHPLWYEWNYLPSDNERINKGYERVDELASKALQNNDFTTYVFCHERPHRLSALQSISRRMPDRSYWELFGAVWIDTAQRQSDAATLARFRREAEAAAHLQHPHIVQIFEAGESENLWQDDTIIGHELRSDRAHKECMMNDEERAFLAQLPDQLTVYRGHQGPRNRDGWSWTLGYFKARWFAERWNQKRASVVQGIVAKQDVIACFLRRHEFEIVVDPRNVAAKTTRNKTINRKRWLKDIWNATAAGFDLNTRTSFHGTRHWEQVEHNGLLLAYKTAGADEDVVRAFAIIHDAKRVEEDDDPGHGERAAEWAKQLWDHKQLPFTEAQLELLMLACRDHEKGLTTIHPTVGVCWDADRLDLTRVGMIPDPALLSTQAAKDNIWNLG